MQGYNLQVTSFSRATAVAFSGGQVTQACSTASDPCLVAQYDAHGLLFCSRDLRFSPTRWTSRILVLYEQMRGANPAFLRARAIGPQVCGTVVCAHVVFESLAISARWRLPPAFLGRSIEVVGKVLGV